MHALPVVTASRARRTLLAATLLVVPLLAGCAQERYFGTGGRPSACGMNAVLYCDVEPRAGLREKRCRCLSSSHVHDMLGTLSRR